MINALRKSKVRIPRNHVLPLENLDLRNRTNKTIITTEDEESVQKKLDIENSTRRRIKEKEGGLEETFEENSDHSNLDHEYTHPIKGIFQRKDKSSKM